MHDWVFEAIGTRWTITTPAPLAAPVVAAVGAEIERIDRAWSRFRDDSAVAEMARAGGSHRVEATDQPLLDWYRRLYDLTGGAVTPLVGGTLAAAGYDADYALRPAESVPPVPAWDDVIAGHDGVLELRRPALIDVGAAGKGFAVDRVAGIVADAVDEYIVDAGGDMVVSARQQPVRIALEHPLDPAKAIGVVTLDGGAICASASNRRAWADWHHIVDPRTASPAWEVLATWVIAPSAMEADGLATALFLTPAARLRGHFDHHADGFHHVTVRRNGSVEHTAVPGLELFL
ncbi:FAD:protein FMN transferase [Gordonia paraffinivorans]|uniref:FAD:protein FMN transferase n=1 Tax=Gordonia paraffinivorans TaxID=175628 RepID=A0ABD7V731_9ACTN|nr:FAD:protein FMN transferase [Gordonia paraffinivorans]MCD2146300.1 FAD:protein FMN transferase [Gordonia paraffinivorans]VFA90006.1 Thiamine biosynthesis lipoprotein ApbE precursor [Gordonia paraffinivorans]